MKKRYGILLQVAILLAVSILLTCVATLAAQRLYAEHSVAEQTEAAGAETAGEVILAVKEFPAWPWLVRYWTENAGTLDIEYDAEFGAGTRTEQKLKTLNEHQPDLRLRYADEAALAALPEEDQRLAAEIAYSWLITRLDQIKRSAGVDYLFCVASEEPFTTQFFLLSAADEGAVRGTAYEQVYPLGVTVQADEARQNAMRGARDDSSHLAPAGGYVDYYACLGEVDGKTVLVGLTYDMTGINARIMAETRRSTLHTMIFLTLLAAIGLALVDRVALRPLRKVQQNIRLYAEDKDSGAVIRNLREVRSRNEIGQLAEDVGSLAREIDDYTARIEANAAEKERSATELALASRIQAASVPSVFPAFPERTDFDIHASMTPAKGVGGDFYDFYLIDGDHLAVTIADVSGKGIPAALFMMITMVLVRTAVENEWANKTEPSPANVLRKVNDQICGKNPEDMFVTVWLGVLELSTGRMKAVNGGHEYPFLKTPGGSFEVLKDRHGLVLGGMPGVRYRDYEIAMEPGSKLFVYTDGVPEATNAAEELFGLDRTAEALREAGEETPEAILAAVDARVRDFVGDAPQFDDLTMLCLHYRG